MCVTLVDASYVVRSRMPAPTKHSLSGLWRLEAQNDVLSISTEADALRLVGELLRSPEGDELLRNWRISGDVGLLGREEALRSFARRLANGEQLFAVRSGGVVRTLDDPADLSVFEPEIPIDSGEAIEPRRPEWIAIRVMNESGEIYPGLKFTLQLPSGEVRNAALDEESRWRADDLPEPGECRVRISRLVKAKPGVA